MENRNSSDIEGYSSSLDNVFIFSIENSNISSTGLFFKAIFHNKLFIFFLVRIFLI